MKLLTRIYHQLCRLEDGLLVFMLLSMVLLASSQILLRNMFQSGIHWGDPALRLMVLWLALLGAMAATRDDNHIRIDLLSRFLPEPIKRLVNRITHGFASLVCGLIAWHGGRFVYFEWQDKIQLFDNLPAWPFEIIIPLGFGIMALRLLAQTITGSTGQQEESL